METELLAPDDALRIDAVGYVPGPAGVSSSPQETARITAVNIISGIIHFEFFIAKSAPFKRCFIIYKVKS